MEPRETSAPEPPRIRRVVRPSRLSGLAQVRRRWLAGGRTGLQTRVRSPQPTCPTAPPADSEAEARRELEACACNPAWIAVCPKLRVPKTYCGRAACERSRRFDQVEHLELERAPVLVPVEANVLDERGVDVVLRRRADIGDRARGVAEHAERRQRERGRVDPRRGRMIRRRKPVVEARPRWRGRTPNSIRAVGVLAPRTGSSPAAP